MSLYNLTLKVIVSPTRIQDMLAQISGHGYETLESFFSTLTGLAIESMGSSTGIERNEMYNHVSSRNRCHIYQVQFESERKEPFEAVFFNEYIIKMLEAASPYVAHNTIAIYNGRKPLVTHEIHIGGKDFEVVRPELKRTASSPPPITPPAPKKVKVMESEPESEAPFHENLMDSMHSKFVLKLIIPDANQDQALSVVQSLGFSSIETFFDALYKMVPLTGKTLDYNQVSHGNGAHIFKASFETQADNYVYAFSKNVIEMIKAISPCCADNFLSLSAPVKQPSGLITYEPFNHYYIAVGRKSRFQYYMGESGEDEESVIEPVKEEEEAVNIGRDEFGTNEVLNETIFSESFLNENCDNDTALLAVKAENQRIYHKIHARYEELLLKLEDLRVSRENTTIEIEITRRLIKELQELV